MGDWSRTFEALSHYWNISMELLVLVTHKSWPFSVSSRMPSGWFRWIAWEDQRLLPCTSRDRSTCSFVRSELNCRNPSSSAMYREESFEAGGWRACIDLFWSRSDVNRNRSCDSLVDSCDEASFNYLCFFLKVKGVNLLQLAFLRSWSTWWLLVSVIAVALAWKTAADSLNVAVEMIADPLKIFRRTCQRAWTEML